MALSASDKKWIRKAIREILAEVIAAEASSTQGGYDGATPWTDDWWAEQGKRPRPRIGFNPENK